MGLYEFPLYSTLIIKHVVAWGQKWKMAPTPSELWPLITPRFPSEEPLHSDIFVLCRASVCLLLQVHIADRFLCSNGWFWQIGLFKDLWLFTFSILVRQFLVRCNFNLFPLTEIGSNLFIEHVQKPYNCDQSGSQKYQHKSVDVRRESFRLFCKTPLIECIYFWWLLSSIHL